MGFPSGFGEVLSPEASDGFPRCSFRCFEDQREERSGVVLVSLMLLLAEEGVAGLQLLFVGCSHVGLVKFDPFLG